MKTYLQKINETTPTRMWVNNPLPSEAEKGLKAGVFGATSNPTYLTHMLKDQETVDDTIQAIDRHIRETKDDHLVVALAYEDMIHKIAEIFIPLFERTHREQGWVAIQGNPYRDDDVDFILEEAHRFYAVSPNIVVKVSATLAGIAAMEKLTSEGHAVLATAGVSNYYAEKMFEAYERGVQAAGKAPTLFVTTLAAPFEGYAKKYVGANQIDCAPDLVEKAGIEMSKHMYRIWKEKYSHLNCRLMGGGVRTERHFTEMVGGDMHVTCGWKFIDELNRKNPAVESRIDDVISEEEREKLFQKIPAFKRAYEEDGMLEAELSAHPPFQLFRNGFLTAWDSLLSIVRERRILLEK
ncbi:MAG: hypothetical protein HFI31_01515 [Lachnospiraceae bacterium]|nr:hypothetical protein [Lachnospiraceae bacterium]MCI9132855.1 hypothetical protein [Lachnospiraceae bacterium]